MSVCPRRAKAELVALILIAGCAAPPEPAPEPGPDLGRLANLLRKGRDAETAGNGDAAGRFYEEAVRDFPRFQGQTEEELLHWLRRLLLNNVADFTRLYHETGKRQVSREVPLERDDSSAERGGGPPTRPAEVSASKPAARKVRTTTKA